MGTTPVTYTYKLVDECAIRADVYRPASEPSGNPVVVSIHGGCLIYGRRTDIPAWQIERHLEAGRTVVSIDYRLAPETKLPHIISDLNDALEWVAHQGPGLFGIDGERLAVAGHSAGGYLALMTGFATGVRPRGIVSFYGYGDLIGDWYSKPDPHYSSYPAVTEEESGRHLKGPVTSTSYEGRGLDNFYLYCRQNGTWPQEVGGRDPDVDAAYFTPFCPLQNVTSSYPPTLLLHGDLDTDVPYQQSVLMEQALQRESVDVKLVTLSGRGHGFDGNPEDQGTRRAFDQVEEFLTRTLG